MDQQSAPKGFLDEKIASFNFFDSSIPHDRILVVEDKKFYVLSGTLSLSSEFFNNMFNGSFREKNITEIVLPDVEAVDFQNFLNVIYPAEFNIDETNLGGLMKFSARFLSPVVWQKCMKYLEPVENINKFDILDLLELSKEYNSMKLKDRIESFLVYNICFMEEEQQFNTITAADKYKIKRFEKAARMVMPEWSSTKHTRFMIHLFNNANDISNAKRKINGYMKNTLAGFGRNEYYFSNLNAVDLYWIGELFAVIHNKNEFKDSLELDSLLRLAKKYNFKKLMNLIANNLSKQFLLTHNFEHLEHALKYNLDSLKTSMENYLKLNAGSISEEAKNILLNGSSEAKHFVLSALL